MAPKVPTSLPSHVAPSASQPSSSSHRSCFFAIAASVSMSHGMPTVCGTKIARVFGPIAASTCAASMS